MAGFIQEPRVAGDVSHNDALAKATYRTCPKCGSSDVRVYASQVQATRARPCRLLGAQILCRCQGDFTMAYGPVSLEATA